MRCLKHITAIIGLAFGCGLSATAQEVSKPKLYKLETPNADILYIGESYEYMVPHLGACFESAWAFHKDYWDYDPSDEKVTLFLSDLSDVGNAGAMVLPRNFVLVNVSPFDYTFDITPGNERFQWLMNHELTHVTMADQSSGLDGAFRNWFGGKVLTDTENPLSSMVFGYLTAPKWYAPRWYHEGIAVFMETWMSGGMGRVLGGYDEMVFRAMVKEDAKFYRPIGLETEGTTIDFQVGMNSYLYGTRFVSYLAATYGVDKLREFYQRNETSSMFYARQFKEVYGKDLVVAWDEWIAFEHDFQKRNLEIVGEYPLTPTREVTDSVLGSVSRPYYDEKKGLVYCAMNRPGDVARIVAIDIHTGDIRKLGEVESPGLYYVTNMAYDSVHQRLYCTTKNSSWRGLKTLDLNSGEETTLFDVIRILEGAYSEVEDAFYGIQNIDGRHTIVKLEQGAEYPERLYSIPFGKSFYDVDVSPDGRYLSGTLALPDGRQQLVVFNLSDLNQGKVDPQVIYEFEDNSASNFTFSRDSKRLYGTSYYTGVSNVWEVDIATKTAELVSNTDVGFFRPIELSDDELLVFEYHAEGLQPVIIRKAQLEDANSIPYLGMEVLAKNPELKDYKVFTSDMPMDELVLSQEEYNPVTSMEVNNYYPIVEGYRGSPAYGMQLNFSDKLNLSHGNVRASYSPDSDLDDDEKLHLNLNYQYWEWEFEAGYNHASFYDLFGPTYEGFAGYYGELSYTQTLNSEKPRSSELVYSLGHYGNLKSLPNNQNVEADYDRMSVASIHYDYSKLSKSLGALEYESGFAFSTDLETALVEDHCYTQVNLSYDKAMLTPWRNSSFWIRADAGKVFSGDEGAHSRMYFGGFGNNYVDRLETQRYREVDSFPGVDIDEISARDYGKLGFEWNLPPIRFEDAGFLYAYARHARLSLFQFNLLTNLTVDEPDMWYSNVGAQVDVDLVLFSLMQSTLSFGYAKAFGEDDFESDEFFISLKIQ